MGRKTKGMKMFKTLLKGLLVLGCALPVVVHTSPGAWMPTAKNISSIIVEGDDNGRALVLIAGGVPSEYIPAACRSGSNGTYNTIPLNTDKGKGMYSMALAAHASGKKVKLALGCTGNRPLITHIWMY